ncbi:tetratricopeptide repeat protein [Frankia sp. Mgl5]|nr:tetratricopeptide repeat protein [Frankia sp. Mgl5]
MVQAVVLAMERHAKEERQRHPPGTFDLSQWKARYHSELHGQDTDVPPPGTGNGLPPDTDLIGRRMEAHDLAALLDIGPGGRPVTVVAGMPGVGKTAFAVRAARDAWATGAFSQILYVDLHGYDPDRRVTTHAALFELLVDLGVAPGEIRDVPASREAQWRRVLAEHTAQGRRLLVLVENASSAKDVEPFLANTGDHRILVTSRHTLTDLSMSRVVELPVLPRDESVALLTRILQVQKPDGHSAAESSLLSRVADLCGDLPLALAIAGGLLVAEPKMSVERLVSELSEFARRLPVLDSGDSWSVRVAFSLSYRHLTDRHRGFFRLLALHPGDLLTAGSAGALADVASPVARDVLRQLRRGHLLEPARTAGSYRFHDLIRAYACELVGEEETDGAQRGALDRLYGYYESMTADARSLLLFSWRKENGSASRFESRDAARAWLDTERVNLVAAVGAATHQGRARHACVLADNIANYLEDKHYVEDSLAVHDHALAAAAGLGARYRMTASTWRGNAARVAYRFAEAERYLLDALEIARSLRARQAEASIQHNLGLTYHRMERYEEAEICHRFDLDFCRKHGDVLGAAEALTALGDALRGRGELTEAAATLERAIALFVTVNYQPGELRARANLVLVRQAQSSTQGVAENIEQLCRVLDQSITEGMPAVEVQTYVKLAEAYRARCPHCHNTSALQWSKKAVEMARDLGDSQILTQALVTHAIALGEGGDLEQAYETTSEIAKQPQSNEFLKFTRAMLDHIASNSGVPDHETCRNDPWTHPLDQLPHSVLSGRHNAHPQGHSGTS